MRPAGMHNRDSRDGCGEWRPTSSASGMETISAHRYGLQMKSRGEEKKGRRKGITCEAGCQCVKRNDYSSGILVYTHVSMRSSNK